MGDDDQEVPAVGGDPDADDLVRPVAVAEELLVGGRVRAHPVAEHARALGRLLRVVDGLLVGGQGNPRVARPRKGVGQLPAAVHLEQFHRDLVLPALPDRVGDERSVFGDVREADRRRVVGRERQRVDEHLVLALETLPDVEDRQVLVGAAAREEIAPAPFRRDADDVHLQQLAQPLLEGGAARQPVQGRPGVGVLRVDPGAGVRSALVFEPAVRVRDLRPLDRLLDVVLSRFRGTRRRRRQGGRDRKKKRDGQEGSANEGEAHGRRSPLVSRSAYSTRTTTPFSKTTVLPTLR